MKKDYFTIIYSIITFFLSIVSLFINILTIKDGSNLEMGILLFGII